MAAASPFPQCPNGSEGGFPRCGGRYVPTWGRESGKTMKKPVILSNSSPETISPASPVHCLGHATLSHWSGYLFVAFAVHQEDDHKQL